MNKILTITLSVNYDDLLDVTLGENKPELDEIIVVTDTKDQKTVEVCKKHKVICVQDDIFYINNSKFNKGMAYNLVMDKLKNILDWVLIIDADVVLPKQFKKNFFSIDPNIEYMYGARRHGIVTPEEWSDVKNNPKNLNKYVLYRGIGYGYFQLFNFKSKIIQNFISNNNKIIYPPHPTAAEADWIFRNYWGDFDFNPKDQNPWLENNDKPLNLLKQLPFHVIHLGQSGVNEWERKSKRFE